MTRKPGRPRKDTDEIGRDDSQYRGAQPGFSAECHPERRELRDGKCRECIAIDRLKAKGETALARTLEEQRAVTEVLTNNVEYLQAIAAEAKNILQERLPDYARMHYDGALVAAANGDTRPSEWALERVTADPPEKGGGVVPGKKEPEKGGGGGVKILIGVGLGGSVATPSQGIIIEQEPA